MVAKTRVIVVDDEPIAAQSTAHIIKKNFADVDVIGIFYSGHIAVSEAVSLHPNIVIMDIRMPGIDGLETMRRMLDHDKNIKFIILSAYSEFEYAAEALSLGACDYLLKPVNQTELAAVIQRTIDALLARQAELNITMEQQAKFQAIRPIIQRDFLRSMLPDANADEKLIACSDFLGYLNTYGCIAIIRQCTTFPCDNLKILTDKLSEAFSMESTVINSQELMLFIPLQKEQFSDGIISDRIGSVLEVIHNNGYEAYCGMGSLQTAGMDIKQSVVEAMSALRLAIYKKSNYVLTYENAKKLSGFNSINPIFPASKRSDMVNTSSIIDKANAFIEKHFSENITLDDAASSVNLSPFYFSRFYKENTGMNFSDKLQNERIKKAKEYLCQSDKSVKETAFLVGYQDPHYFSRVFKKVTGYTASDYKETYSLTGKIEQI